jgi:PKD repeat protein
VNKFRRELFIRQLAVPFSFICLFPLTVLLFLGSTVQISRAGDLASSTTSPISYIAGTLNNSKVIAGEPVYFEVTVKNISLSEVILESNTTFSFSAINGSSHFSSSLLGSTNLPANAQAVLKFEISPLSPSFLPGNTTPVLELSGQYSGGGEFTQSLTLSDSVSVLAQQDGIVEVNGTLEPTEPSRRSKVVFWIRLENTTSCPIRLDNGTEVILRDGQQWLQRTPLLRNIIIEPGEVARVEFGTRNSTNNYVSSYIKDSIPDGIYYPNFRLFGERICDGVPFNANIVSAQSLSLNPPTGEIGGFGSSFGNWPVFTQNGGVIQLKGASGTTTDPYQILVQVELSESTTCSTSSPCKLLPIDKVHLDAEFIYLQGSGTWAITNVYIKPTPDMASDLPWQFISRILRMTRNIGSGVGIVSGVRIDVKFYIAERNGLLDVTKIIPENTFVPKGETFRVSVVARNPDSGEPNYPIHPLNNSRLLLNSEGLDVSHEFNQLFMNSNIAIHQQNHRNALFQLTPISSQPMGKILFGTHLSSQGVYPYYYGGYYGDTTGEPYSGPNMINIPNTAIFPAESSLGFVYVVDSVPLGVVDEQALAIGSQLRQLSVEIDNRSQWNFSIEPGSSVELLLEPKNTVVINTMGIHTSTLVGEREHWAQSFRPDKPFHLNTIDFILYYFKNNYVVAEDIKYSAEIIPANEDGTLPISANFDVAPAESIATVNAVIPSGTQATSGRLRLKTPEFNVLLEQDKLYFVIFRFDTQVSMFGIRNDDIDAYPNGRIYIYQVSAITPRWYPHHGDIDLKFHAHRIGYRATTVLEAPLILETNRAVIVPFEFSQPFTDVLDGTYKAEILLFGTATGAEDSFEFHQRLSTSNPSVMVDSVAPSVAVSPLPELHSHPQIILSWSGVDDASGILDYDVQVKSDGGEWIDWLKGTPHLEGVFTGVSGHTYAFRVRARDRAHNISQWTEAVETRVVFNPPIILEINAPTVPQAIATPVNVTARFTDADSEGGHTADWDWGDGTSSSGAITGDIVSGSHSYDHPGLYTISLKVRDEGGLEDELSYQSVAVYVPVNAGSDQIVDEGNIVILSATVENYDANLLAYEWDIDNDGIFETVGKIADFAAVDGPNSYVATVRATPPTGPSSMDSVTIIINNVAPTIAPITASIDPVLVNSLITAEAKFTDPGTLDTHTGVWDWGDGTITPATIFGIDGSGSASDAHIYTSPGIYTIKLAVSDKDGGTSKTAYEYVVVYDPTGGFVTGGGWINSPAGAYIANPTLTGKANFGFVAKYQKGANIPTGDTEFQFKAGDLNFKSTTYDWLVVAGAKAQFKGVGAINGAGEYGFILTAVDGQISGGGGTDTFRIKIWDKGTDSLVYDNQIGATDDADPVTSIGGGSIIIHKPK